jgi:hypothetical protein
MAHAPTGSKSCYDVDSDTTEDYEVFSGFPRFQDLEDELSLSEMSSNNSPPELPPAEKKIMETLANDTADLGDVESLSESKLKDNKGSDDDDTIVDDVTVNKENVIPFINDYETPLAPQRSITKKVNVVTKKKVVKYSLQDKKNTGKSLSGKWVFSRSQDC